MSIHEREKMYFLKTHGVFNRILSCRANLRGTIYIFFPDSGLDSMMRRTRVSISRDCLFHLYRIDAQRVNENSLAYSTIFTDISLLLIG